MTGRRLSIQSVTPSYGRKIRTTVRRTDAFLRRDRWRVAHYRSFFCLQNSKTIRSGLLFRYTFTVLEWGTVVRRYYRSKLSRTIRSMFCRTIVVDAANHVLRIAIQSPSPPRIKVTYIRVVFTRIVRTSFSRPDPVPSFEYLNRTEYGRLRKACRLVAYLVSPSKRVDRVCYFV